MSIKAYPLHWPDGWPRTQRRKQFAPYKTAFFDAFEDARRELKLFKAFGVVISTDVPLRRDGLPYADGDAGARDPGVAVYFTRGKEQYVFACDLYDRVRFNMRALGLAFGGLRAVERAGITQVIDRAMGGFAQLGSGAPSADVLRPWREVLNLDGLAGPDFAVRAAIEASYKSLSRDRHPDAGGSETAMVELNLARERALREVTGG